MWLSYAGGVGWGGANIAKTCITLTKTTPGCHEKWKTRWHLSACWTDVDYMLNRCGVCDEFTWIIYVGFMLVRCWIDVEYIQSRVEANQWTLGFCLSNMVTPICARLRDDRPLLVEFPLKVDSWRHWVPHSGWAARRAPGWRRSLMYSCQGPPRTGRWVSAKENN